MAFIFTFTVVASFWWTHSAIFRNYFVPTRLMVFLNFVALAAVVLQVFALQLWLHFGASHVDDRDAARIYFGIFSITFLTITLLSGLGTRYRWPDLTPELRLRGVQRMIHVGCTALGTAIGTAFASANAGSLSVSLASSGANLLAVPNQILLGLLGGFIVGRIVAAIVTRTTSRKTTLGAGLYPASLSSRAGQRVGTLETPGDRPK